MQNGIHSKIALMKFVYILIFYFFPLPHGLCQISRNASPIANNNATAYRNETVFEVRPNWEIDSPALIKDQSISKDSVFLYRRRKNNRDSTLAFVEYFDSLGNKMESDEYTINKGQLWRITNYNYDSDLLFKKEEISESIIKINGSNPIQKNVSTYEYDNLGNNVSEKLYSNTTDSSRKISVTVWQREFDSSGHQVKEFEALPGQKTSLRHKYYYMNGKVSVVETYDVHQKWIYSYQYKYNNQKNLETVFMINNFPEPQIQKKYFYDEKNRLIKEENYTEGRIYLDHSTEMYAYNTNGVVIWQSYQDIAGNNYYYRHFYTPSQIGGYQIQIDSANDDKMDSSDYDKTFTKVEIESEYPGGPEAWAWFLIRNLHYPDFAVNSQIQGDVMVVFIVDKEGNVSDVHANYGPPELRDEAVRVIKKSGKWTPAIVNGRQVKSYKNQPIKFRLG
jgi:hypothetical protein